MSVSRPSLDCQGLVLWKDSLGLFLSRHPREALGREGRDRGYSHLPAVKDHPWMACSVPYNKKMQGESEAPSRPGLPNLDPIDI